jgi:hypothetical protein
VFGRWAADRVEEAILAEGADTVAAVFVEPVQNAGGFAQRAAVRAVPLGSHLLPARLHVRRPPGLGGRRQGEHRPAPRRGGALAMRWAIGRGGGSPLRWLLVNAGRRLLTPADTEERLARRPSVVAASLSRALRARVSTPKWL